jgi:hypothetical protein
VHASRPDVTALLAPCAVHVLVLHCAWILFAKKSSPLFESNQIINQLLQLWLAEK